MKKTIIFHDGADEPDHRQQGPPLHHFRTWTLAKERKYLKQMWKTAIETDVMLPTSMIKLYDDEGDFVSNKYYIEGLVTDLGHPQTLDINESE